MPHELIERTGKLRDGDSAWAAIAEYVKSPPDNGTALIDVLVTTRIILSVRTLSQLAKDRGLRNLATPVPSPLLERRARGLGPVLANGVVVGGSLTDPARRSDRQAAFLELADIFEGTLRGYVNAATDELASLLVDGHTRAQIAGISQLDAHKEAQASYEHYVSQRFDEALVGFQRLKELNPFDAYYRAMLGAVHLQRGQDDLALPELLMARELDAGNLEVACNLLEVLVRLSFVVPAAILGRRLIERLGAQGRPEHESMLTLAHVAATIAIGVVSFFCGVTAADVGGAALDLDMPPMGELASNRLRSLLTAPLAERGGLIDKQLFISYRRADTGAIVERFHERLAREHSRITIFRDVSSMFVAEDVESKLGKELQASDLVLVFIGPEWSRVRDRSGRRRLDDSADLVRREVASALRSGHLVAPILVDGATMPAADTLPAELRELPGRNGYKLSTEAFDDDFGRLLIALSDLLRASKRAHMPALDEIERMLDAGDTQFLDLPQYVHATAAPGEGIPMDAFTAFGEWECVIAAGSDRTTLRFTIDQRSGFAFEGTLVSRHSGITGLLGTSSTSQLVGRWATLEDHRAKRVLGIRLRGVQDQSTRFALNVPMTEDVGDGYFGRSPDGRTFYSRNVRPRTRLL